jgi:hypothetical protein
MVLLIRAQEARNSVIRTIHGRPRPPIFGGTGTEPLSEYSGVLAVLNLSHYASSQTLCILMLQNEPAFYLKM